MICPSSSIVNRTEYKVLRMTARVSGSGLCYCFVVDDFPTCYFNLSNVLVVSCTHFDFSISAQVIHSPILLYFLENSYWSFETSQASPSF